MKVGLSVALATTAISSAKNCLYLPQDPSWPSTSDWSSLNSTVGGRLVATVPIGSPCHAPNYDEAACATLQADWYLPQTHFTSSSSVMQSYFANQSCDPFTSESQACTLGNYVDYAVNVSSSDDVIAAVKFAQEKNIRFVIRNTGHDYLGRSTGAGALSVWTHYLNDIELKEWSDGAYSGPAFQVGAGTMGYQILDAATAHGLVVVTGECPTVGLAGGYTQGGGHSALSSSFGLGADQTLEFSVVTAAGELVTASREENSDLFWALSGGGAGNYGVVISMTVKAHQDTVTSGAGLEFTVANISQDTFFEAVAEFHRLLPAMINEGVTVIYEMTDAFFAINPITAYNKTKEEVEPILAPFLAVLTNLGIAYSASYTQFDSYKDHYNNYMGPLPYGNLEVGTYNYGGRLIPRQTLKDKYTDLAEVLRNLTTNGVIAVGVGMDVSNPGNVYNAVFPALRNAAVTMQFGSTWNETAPWGDMVADQEKITHEYGPQLEAVTPGSGSYQNEGNFRQLHWKETFFGDNYHPLLKVKENWDPKNFFYVLKGVGSDAWAVQDSGRMCRT
ncbi:hypothetical protein N7495_007379 [Penicillium taxi]|uniref:uncharacterized protein n=1 Tax=Penicillium taxi TaxID=168475 RepID=UPI002544D887|nr:uncharacterized protein N7495_007379 [Penicillium taxi]KAJ5895688.1 hypothetical protein N7495_007379 [Penicillium taxi]